MTQAPAATRWKRHRPHRRLANRTCDGPATQNGAPERKHRTTAPTSATPRHIGISLRTQHPTRPPVLVPSRFRICPRIIGYQWHPPPALGGRGQRTGCERYRRDVYGHAPWRTAPGSPALPGRTLRARAARSRPRGTGHRLRTVRDRETCTVAVLDPGVHRTDGGSCSCRRLRRHGAARRRPNLSLAVPRVVVAASTGSPQRR